MATTTDTYLGDVRARSKRARGTRRRGCAPCAQRGRRALRGRSASRRRSDEEWRFTNVAPIADDAVRRRADRRRRSRGATLARFVVPGARRRRARRSSTAASRRGCRRSARRRRGVTVVVAGRRRSRSDPASLAAAPRPPRGRRRAGRSPRSTPRSFEDGALDRDRRRRASSSEPIQLLFLSTVDRRRRPCRTRACSSSLGRNSQARVVETFAGARARPRLHQRGHRDRGRRRRGARPLPAAAREPTTAFHIGHTQFQLGRSSQLVVARRSRSAACSRATTSIAVLGGEGADCTLNGLYLADGSQLVDNHTDDRPRQAARHEPRALQGHPRRPGARRLQRQDRRPPGRAEDRREADEQDPAALRRRADQHEAAARDLRRRREVHARRDRRPARRGRAVLPARARHRPRRGAAPADPRVRRRT